MSKSPGNIIRPEEVVEKAGRDTFRFYMLWATNPWENLRFSWKAKIEKDIATRTVNFINVPFLSL
ncbi:hypothetical protein PNA2_0211 [Pyrococcus sp. NA2]|nr:hypothetical protein PNA2_0211 [Pyrococcus sp. NA2]